MPRGSTQALATMVTEEVTKISDVVKLLAQIRDYAASTSPLRNRDGIASFTHLYHLITATIDQEPFRDQAFLTRLDIEFARRYFRALRAYAEDTDRMPRSWKVLFDRRDDADIAPVQFAAAGVNAHINYDLTAALLATFVAFPPTETRRADFNVVNDIFERHMDNLRETLGSLFSEGDDGDFWDRVGNRSCDLVVRFTRSLAWDRAIEVWEDRDRDKAAARMDDRLDGIAHVIGWGLLEAPGLPV